MHAFEAAEEYARFCDAADPLGEFRGQFHMPRRSDGREAIYFCGNSLGLQPQGVRLLVEQELNDWARLGVEAHFHGQRPWYFYHENFRDHGARLVGGRPDEIVMMNSLTVNLHLMMVSFYRPRRDRHLILVDSPTFPSDLYAIKSQIRYHGSTPEHSLLLLQPRPGEVTIREADIEEILDRRGKEIALALLSGVNFYTGQWFDIPRITAAAQQQGCIVGWDLAHAVGNVPLQLHDWNVDFAVWCSYKYLNAGPGAAAGCFVHQRHGDNLDLPRFAGWWGNDPATRFQMHLQSDFTPRPGADGWQISNPPILSMTPLIAALEIFDAAGMNNLRRKSEQLTGYLAFLLGQLPAGRVEIITPQEPSRRGCQLSMLIHDRPRDLFQALVEAGVVCDFREPNVVRVAPTPLYNTFEEVWRFAQTLRQVLR